MGHIATIKMNVPPKVMSILQNIPIVKDNKVWTVWNKKISRFIWLGKKPHINLRTLMDYAKGRLQLPNFRLYQEVVCLSWAKDWIEQKKK